MEITQHFRVRSVMSTRNSTAVTLTPVEWLKDDPSGAKVIEHGESWPQSVEAYPNEPGAEALEVGGPMTEIRIPANVKVEPDLYVTMTIHTTGKMD